MAEKLNPFEVIDHHTKVYSDGRTGGYFCKCHDCGMQFIGFKLDSICGDCAEPPGSELNIIGEKEK